MARYDAEELQRYVDHIHGMLTVTNYVSALVGAGVFGLVGFFMGQFFSRGYGETGQTYAVIGALLGGFIAYRIADLAGAWLMIASHSALCLREIEGHLRNRSVNQPRAEAPAPGPGLPTDTTAKPGDVRTSIKEFADGEWDCWCGFHNEANEVECVFCHRSRGWQP